MQASYRIHPSFLYWRKGGFKMNFKKTISVITSAVLLLSSSCGLRPDDGAAATPTEGAFALTVTCFDSMVEKSFLETAAQKFEEKHPGINITVESFSSAPEIKTMEQDGKKMATVQITGDNEQEKTDYVNSVNTALMGGKGADILAMDVLPYMKYAENGQLVDLAPYMDSDPEFSAADYSENILNAARYNGAQYIFPTAYTFNYYAYDSSLFNEAAREQINSGGPFALQQLIELAADSFSPGGESKLINATKFILFEHLLKENYNKFVNSETKTANFTSGEFESLLELIEDYAQKGYLSENVARGEAVSMEDLQEVRMATHYIKTQQSPMLLQFFNKNANFRVQMGTASSNTENDVLAGVAADADGEAPFSYSNAYAINSNSQNKDLAWEFIKFLSSPDMADSLEVHGVPLNVEARAVKAEKMISGEMRSGIRFSGEMTLSGDVPENAPEPTESAGLTEEQQKALDDYLTTIESYTARLTKLAIPDDAIVSVIRTEAENYFTGAKSAAEVASALQNRISLYLNE